MTVFTRASQLSLSWASLIQSTRFHPISLRFIWILSFNLRLRLPAGLYLQVSQPKPCMNISCFPCVPHTPPISSFWFDYPSNLDLPIPCCISCTQLCKCPVAMRPRHSAATCSVSISRSVRWGHFANPLSYDAALSPAHFSRFVRCGSVQMLRLHILYRSSHKTPWYNVSIRAPCSGTPCYAVYSQNIFYLSLSTIFRLSWRPEKGTRDLWHCVTLGTELQ